MKVLVTVIQGNCLFVSISKKGSHVNPRGANPSNVELAVALWTETLSVSEPWQILRNSPAKIHVIPSGKRAFTCRGQWVHLANVYRDDSNAYCCRKKWSTTFICLLKCYNWCVQPFPERVLTKKMHERSSRQKRHLSSVLALDVTFIERT
jgi:hypothetical protein